MIRFWRETFWVAAYETGEAARTRLLQMATLGYLGALGAFNALLVLILREIERGAAEALGVQATERPGAMLAQLQADGKLDEVARFFVGRGSDEQVQTLLREPVLALWATAGAMLLLPVLSLLSSSGTVATELRSRSIRYLACRTGRLQIALGKLIGQLGFATIALVAGLVLTWVMGMTLMVQVPPAALASSLLLRAPRTLAYTFPMVAMGLAASQVTASPNGARFLALILMLAMPIGLGALMDHVGPDTVGRLADLGVMMISLSSWEALWSLDAGEVLAAAGRCVVLALAYFSIGFLFFRRRDL